MRPLTLELSDAKVYEPREVTLLVKGFAICVIVWIDRFPKAAQCLLNVSLLGAGVLGFRFLGARGFVGVLGLRGSQGFGACPARSLRVRASLGRMCFRV